MGKALKLIGRAIKKQYESSVPKSVRKEVGKQWRSEGGNAIRKQVLHGANRAMTKYKGAAVRAMGTAGAAAGGYVGGPAGAEVGRRLASRGTKSLIGAAQKLGRGQERRVDRRRARGFE